jgi:CTP synthase
LPVEIPEQSPNGIQHRDSGARPIPEPATRG